MRFCQAFISELFRHVGSDTDVPAGDIGVGGREVAFMAGMYKKLANRADCVFTGKGLAFGGSLIRPEATGFGTVYFAQEMLKTRGKSFDGLTVSVSGSGNVAQFAIDKAMALGAKVVSASDSSGTIYDAAGFDGDKLVKLMDIKNKQYGRVSDYAKQVPGVEYYEGKTPWFIKADVALPCATQNDVNLEEAKKIVANGIKYYIEVANMPTTNEALTYLRKQKNMIVAPSKAVNAGGVSVSGLEMSQNSERLSWTEEEVDQKLHQIMKNIHDASVAAAEEFGLGYNLVAGANIAGFKKVADAMMAHGIV